MEFLSFVRCRIKDSVEEYLWSKNGIRETRYFSNILFLRYPSFQLRLVLFFNSNGSLKKKVHATGNRDNPKKEFFPKRRRGSRGSRKTSFLHPKRVLNSGHCLRISLNRCWDRVILYFRPVVPFDHGTPRQPSTETGYRKFE